MSVGFILVRYRPAYLLFVSTPVSLSDKEVVPLPVCFFFFFLSLQVILMSSMARSYTSETAKSPSRSKGRCL